MRAVAAALLLLVLALPAWGAEPRRATLRLESTSPLVVRGRFFGARERVVVTAISTETRGAMAVRADRDGRFEAHFTLRLGRCEQVTVRAVGMRGNRASLLLAGCDGKVANAP